MNNETAIKVLIMVGKMAQKAGVLSLEDASVVLQAIKLLEVPEPETPTAEAVTKAEKKRGGKKSVS